MAASAPHTDADADATLMSTTDVQALAALTQRDIAALTQFMLVVADHPDVWSDAEVVVYSEAREYIVNLDVGYCDCPDNHYRNRECKHLKRARYQRGEYAIPDAVDVDALDDPLRELVEGGR